MMEENKLILKYIQKLSKNNPSASKLNGEIFFEKKKKKLYYLLIHIMRVFIFLILKNLTY